MILLSSYISIGNTTSKELALHTTDLQVQLPRPQGSPLGIHRTRNKLLAQLGVN